MVKKEDVDLEEPEESEEIEEVEEVAEGREFAFAMAPVVRLMREELDSDKLIRSRVKREMNLWLEKVCRKVTQEINKSEYTVVELDDFKTAIEPYEMIDDVEQERHRIVATLEKIKQDCDSLIRDVNRKFITYEPSKVEEGAESELE
jgi:histone H3/H4